MQMQTFSNLIDKKNILKKKSLKKQFMDISMEF